MLAGHLYHFSQATGVSSGISRSSQAGAGVAVDGRQIQEKHVAGLVCVYLGVPIPGPFYFR